jgi:hypothetical protein
VLFAGAIDMEAGLVISDITEERFTAPEVKPSDNLITLSVDREGFTTTSIKISTTNNDQYAIQVAPEDYFAGKTDEEILANLSARDLSNAVLNGSRTVELADRTPGATYCVYAFGYLSGVATTGLVKIKFTTRELDESTIALNIRHDKYFDAAQLKAAYPGEFGNMPGAIKAVLPVWAEVTPATAGARVWYNVYQGDYTQNTAVYKMAETLLKEGCTYPGVNLYFPYEESLGVPHTLIGIVADAEGRFGGIFREVVVLTREGMSPVEEYVSPTSGNSGARFDSAARAFAPAADSGHSGFDVKQVPAKRQGANRGPMSVGEFARVRGGGTGHSPVRARARVEALKY